MWSQLVKRVNDYDKFCGNCLYFICYNRTCNHKSNIVIQPKKNWMSNSPYVTYRECPQKLNKDNRCKNYSLSKRHER